MPITVRTKHGSGATASVEETVVNRGDEVKTIPELAKEQAEIDFKLARKGHKPNQLLVRQAEIDAAIASKLDVE
jgi:hypothetical protein